VQHDQLWTIRSIPQERHSQRPIPRWASTQRPAVPWAWLHTRRIAIFLEFSRVEGQHRAPVADNTTSRGGGVGGRCVVRQGERPTTPTSFSAAIDSVGFGSGRMAVRATMTERFDKSLFVFKHGHPIRKMAKFVVHWWWFQQVRSRRDSRLKCPEVVVVGV
jgi:hypothetical protein